MSGDGMLLDGPLSILSTPAFGRRGAVLESRT